MEPRAKHFILAAGLMVLAVMFLGGCSKGKDVSDRPRVGARVSKVDSPGIVPSPAYGFHELQLESDASAASFGGLTGADKGQLVIWAVNGENVHTGPSLDPLYTSPGDHVTAIVKAADKSGNWREIERYETVVRDSAPKVEDVGLQSESTNPYLIHAVVRAVDPDHQNLTYEYRWFVNGELQENQSSSQLQLDKKTSEAKIEVEVNALDGELRSDARRSSTLQWKAPSAFLEVAAEAQVREVDGGAREYLLPLQFPPDATIKLIHAPPSVRLESGTLIWKPAKNETELKMKVRVEAVDGSSMERDISLSI